MGGTPITLVDSGGTPVTNMPGKASPFTPVDSGGIPATLVDAGGQPVSLVNEDGTAWSDGAEVQAFAFQTETDTLAAAHLVAPTANRKLWQDRGVRRLKTSGIWAKARWLRFQGADADASVINWKIPAEKGTIVGAPPFTADQHFAGATGLNYINIGLLASALQQNNLGVFAWFQTGPMDPTASQSGATLGAINASSTGISLVPNNSNSMNMRIGGTNMASAGATDGFGLIGGSRFNATEVETYYNGAKRATVANASAALPALPIYICGLNNNGSITNGNTLTQSFLYLGEALTQAEVRILTSIVGEWLETIRYGDYYFEEPGVGTATINLDMAAYGLTGQSVHWAVAAKRANPALDVAIIGGWRDRFSFGMAGGGLGYTDFDASTGLGGLPRWVITDCNAQEVVTDVATGTNPAAFKFNPKRFNRTMKALLKLYDIPVYLTDGIVSASKTGTEATEITTADGRVIAAQQWHDGSYELDLLRHIPGVSTFKGREAAGSGNEASNGVRNYATAAEPLNAVAAVVQVDPWVTPGTPASGLLPGIQAVASTFHPELHTFPTVGSADTRIPAYNFRLTMTTTSHHRFPLPTTPPPGFDIANYEVYLRWLAACTASGSPATISTMFKTDDLRATGRYDLNKEGIMSTNLTGQNHGYPLGTYAEREIIWKKVWNHIMGLWYVLQHHVDARIPAAIRTEALTWGLCTDHYYSPHENDDPFVMPQMYIREASRLVSDVVMNGTHMDQTDGQAPTLGNKTVSVASYSMDSHSTQVIAHETADGVWQLKHEGGMFIEAGGADNISPLPLGIFVPKIAECTNASCSFGGSLTHTAYGSSRMEFTAMQTAYTLGWLQAAALAGDNVIQTVDYPTARTALLAYGSRLSGEVAEVIPETT